MTRAIVGILILLSFTLHAQTWKQLGQDIDGEAAGDLSGSAIAISSDGSTVAVGAFKNDGTGIDAGHVRVYRLHNGFWKQVGWDIEGEAPYDESGFSVSLNYNGSIVAVGSWTKTTSKGYAAGHVRIFELKAGYWKQVGGAINGEAADDYSGYDISLSSDGTTVAIGARWNSESAYRAGHVRVFKLNSGVWTQLGADIDGEAAYDMSGFSVSLSSDSNIVAIGAQYNSDNGSDAGHVRVYKLVSGVWVQQGADIDGKYANELFGHDVSLSSDGLILASGAMWSSVKAQYAGAVRVYKYSSGAWTQLGGDIFGNAANDFFGSSVSISSDGLTVATGAIGQYGTGMTGYANVFKFISGNWVKQGGDLKGEAIEDQCGWSVSLSSDGSKVAIGAQRNDASGINAGHARVFYSCYHTSSNIKVTRCFKYKAPSGDETYTVSGIYEDIIPNYAGCDSVITINLTINTVDVKVTRNTPILTANASGAKYQWLDCDNGFSILQGDTNKSFTATTNGNYAVEIIQKGCIDTSFCYDITGIGLKEIELSNFVLHPNPTSGIVNIKPLNNYEELTVHVFNELGEIVIDKTFNNNEKIVLKINGPQGIYFVNLINVNAIERVKVMKY